MTKKATTNVTNSSNLFDNVSKPRKTNRKAEPQAEPQAEKTFKKAVRSIKALCTLLSTKTVMPYDKVKAALFEQCGKNIDTITALAENIDIYRTVVERVIDKGELMTLAIPMAYYTAKQPRLLEVERNILNIITPYQKSKQWTCGAVENRNAPTTWGIAQGCFVETINGLTLLSPTLREPLKTSQKTTASGEKETAPKVEFQWRSKAARIRAFALKAYGNKTALDETMLYYGCDRTVLDGLDKAEASVNATASGSKQTKKEQAQTVKHLLSTYWDED